MLHTNNRGSRPRFLGSEGKDRATSGRGASPRAPRPFYYCPRPTDAPLESGALPARGYLTLRNFLRDITTLAAADVSVSLDLGTPPLSSGYSDGRRFPPAINQPGTEHRRRRRPRHSGFHLVIDSPSHPQGDSVGDRPIHSLGHSGIRLGTDHRNDPGSH